MDILNDKHFNNFSNSLFDQSIKSKVKGRYSLIISLKKNPVF
jgi:hypothetical protein